VKTEKEVELLLKAIQKFYGTRGEEYEIGIEDALNWVLDIE